MTEVSALTALGAGVLSFVSPCVMPLMPAPFLLMALSLERFFHVFARVKQHFKAIEVVSGLLLVTVGVLIVFDLLIRLNENFSFLLDVSLWLESSLL